MEDERVARLTMLTEPQDTDHEFAPFSPPAFSEARDSDREDIPSLGKTQWGTITDGSW